MSPVFIPFARAAFASATNLGAEYVSEEDVAGRATAMSSSLIIGRSSVAAASTADAVAGPIPLSATSGASADSNAEAAGFSLARTSSSA